MPINKWIIVDKEKGRGGLPNTYIMVYVGEPNCPKTGIFQTTFDMQIGTLIQKNDNYMEPIENLYTNQTNVARVELATCREFNKKQSIKVSLFGINYGIFECVISKPQSNMKLKRGDIVMTALWKKPDDTIELHIIKNLTTNMQYICNDGAKFVQDMVVLDADMAGAFDTKTSYKHLLVSSFSGVYSMIVPSTDSLFSVHEKDEILVSENYKTNQLEILDNKSINNVISDYVRQRQK